MILDSKYKALTMLTWIYSPHCLHILQYQYSYYLQLYEGCRLFQSWHMHSVHYMCQSQYLKDRMKQKRPWADTIWLWFESRDEKLTCHVIKARILAITVCDNQGFRSLKCVNSEMTASTHQLLAPICPLFPVQALSPLHYIWSVMKLVSYSLSSTVKCKAIKIQNSRIQLQWFQCYSHRNFQNPHLRESCTKQNHVEFTD